MEQPVLIQKMNNLGDLRGWSFRIPEEALAFLGEIHEMHMISINPGCVRGNHVHTGRKEVLFLQFEAECEFAWALRDSDQVHIEMFSNPGGIMIQIAPDVVHTIKNIGSQSMILLACSDGMFDPEYKDTERRVILT